MCGAGEGKGPDSFEGSGSLKTRPQVRKSHVTSPQALLPLPSARSWAGPV